MRNRRNTRKRNVVMEFISNKNFIRISSILLVIMFICITIIVVRKQQDKILVAKQAEEFEKQKQEVFTAIDKNIEEQESVNFDRLKIAKISAVGDILCQMNMIEDANEKGTYNFDHMFSNIEQFVKKSDIAVGTLETNFVDGKFIGVGKYNTPVEFLKSVRKSGINMVSMAHNHQLDYGIDGMNSTIKKVQDNDFSIVGIKNNKENENKDFTGNIKEVDGIKIAFIGYTYGLSNEKEIKEEDKKQANIFSEELLKKDLEYAKKNSNYIICLMHWGEVNSQEISKEQNEITDILVNNGVDMILGAHPSVVEPMKIIKNKEGRNVLVAYSLGNYISTFGYKEANVEIILNIEIAKRDSMEKAVLKKVDYNPIYILDNGVKAENRFELMDMKKLISDYAKGLTKKISRKTYDELIKKLNRLQEVVNNNK